MPLAAYKGVTPTLAEDVFVAPTAWLTGDVTIGPSSSIFFGAVLRGDILPIIVGRGSNIQDHAMVHSSGGMTPAIIGNDVTVGHRAIIHGATIGNRTIVGMGATILDMAEIGEDCIIGAHTLITKSTRIPPKSLVMGTPGKVVRELTQTELQEVVKSAEHYRITAAEYLRSLG